MSAIHTDHFSGGSNVQKGHGTRDDLAKALRDVADDFTAIRTALLNLGTKLDADAGVTDVNYNTTIAADLGTQATTKA